MEYFSVGYLNTEHRYKMTAPDTSRFIVNVSAIVLVYHILCTLQTTTHQQVVTSTILQSLEYGKSWNEIIKRLESLENNIFNISYPQKRVGLQGLPGERGTTGLQGLPGERGTTGLQGLPGERGTTGLQGLPGERGTTGLQGLPGERADITPGDNPITEVEKNKMIDEATEAERRALSNDLQRSNLKTD